LGGEGKFDIAGEDSTVADLWCDHFIDREKRALTKVGFLWLRVSVSGGCAGRFAVKIGSVMVSAAIGNLSRQSGEQRLRAFRTVNHVELPFRLCADTALFGRDVISSD